MQYPFMCGTHGAFFVHAPMKEGPPSTVACPECGEECVRVYVASPVVYKGHGFHTTDYARRNLGRGQPMDKKEWLNSNWSKATGEAPPPVDSGKPE